MHGNQIFLNQAQPASGFLKLFLCEHLYVCLFVYLFVCVCVCVCVCGCVCALRLLITSGVMCLGMDLVNHSNQSDYEILYMISASVISLELATELLRQCIHDIAMQLNISMLLCMQLYTLLQCSSQVHQQLVRHNVYCS